MSLLKTAVGSWLLLCTSVTSSCAPVDGSALPGRYVRSLHECHEELTLQVDGTFTQRFDCEGAAPTHNQGRWIFDSHYGPLVLGHYIDAVTSHDLSGNWRKPREFSSGMGVERLWMTVVIAEQSGFPYRKQ